MNLFMITESIASVALSHEENGRYWELLGESFRMPYKHKINGEVCPGSYDGAKGWGDK